jgi:hypothetical protein
VGCVCPVHVPSYISLLLFWRHETTTGDGTKGLAGGHGVEGHPRNWGFVVMCSKRENSGNSEITFQKKPATETYNSTFSRDLVYKCEFLGDF